MTPSFKKRFWKEARITATLEGYGIALDGRSLKTPSKADLLVPNQEIAQMIAAEWDAQLEKINPEEMPATRAANAAIDKVSVDRAGVIEMLVAYGDSDLVCYRAISPDGLIARQVKIWDPLIAWTAENLDITLATTQGVMPIGQPARNRGLFEAQLSALTDFELTAMHDLIMISGSIVISLALCANHIRQSEAWEASRIDENWQIEQWGADEEAEELTLRKKESFQFAHRFYRTASRIAPN